MVTGVLQKRGRLLPFFGSKRCEVLLAWARVGTMQISVQFSSSSWRQWQQQAPGVPDSQRRTVPVEIGREWSN